MANFIKQQAQPYLSNEYDWYWVDGILNQEDINKINSYPKNIRLIINNTKGQDSELIKKITSKRVSFSIIGGLDYFNKKKYQEKHYIERTIIEPAALSKIIKFFEKMESKLRYSWTDAQKCMYIYKTIVENFHYSYDSEPEFVNGKDVVRSLYGVLYNRLVCVGFTLVFKEAMDRIGIKCYYQNKKSIHGWNIVELDGKLRALDLTWDCYNKGKNNTCYFYYFGTNEDFYQNKHHDLTYENEETEFPIVPFTHDECSKIYEVITNEKNIKKQKMSSLIDENGNKIYYLVVNDLDPIKQYIIYLEDMLVPIYSDLEPDKCLSKEKIMNAIKYNNNNIFPLKENSQNSSKTYYRDDNSCFVVEKNKQLENKIFEHYYYDILINNNELLIRRGVVLSENDLTLNYEEKVNKIIANSLLSTERLREKILNYNGYVGYIRKDHTLCYNGKFERNELNINRIL